jgi:hypothetical protein
MISDSCASFLGQPLRLLPEQAPLQALILLAQVQQQLPILVALLYQR